MATELALLASALFGVGVAYSRHMSKTTTLKDLPGSHTPIPRKHPEPMEVGREGAPTSMRLPAMNPNPMVPGRRRDNSALDRGETLEDRQPYLSPPIGTKREVLNTEPLKPQDNVLVRSSTNYRGEYLSTLDRPNRMHGVNPVATTTGTAGQLVGPGVLASADELTGTHGLHYGMVRMRPHDVHSHFREQKGSIVPGKSLIDKPTNTVPVEERRAATATFGESGHVAGDSNNPQRYFAISEEYHVSAPGRAVVTGTPGAGGQRLEPRQHHTNRGNEGVVAGHQYYGHAQDSRQKYQQSDKLLTERGNLNEYLGVPVAGATSALTTSSYNLPRTERDSTECSRGNILTNLANPGQQVAPTRPGNVLDTQRGSVNEFQEGNLAPQAPDGMLVPPTQLRDTQRVNNEYRPGGIGTSSLTIGGHGRAEQSLDGSRMSQPSQREATQTDYVGPLKSVGVVAAMSYQDILSSEGYALRDVPQSGYSTPANSFNSVLEPSSIGKVEAGVPQPNMIRDGGGGVSGYAQHANAYVLNNNLESHPNKGAVMNTRLDPRVLEALTRNEFSRVSKGGGVDT